MKHEYWIAGNLSVPEEKKEELNLHILQLLQLCGIRKLKEMEIGEKTITVVSEPKPDEEGIVRFDYSIFEQKRRQVSIYNENTCELEAADSGLGEFELAMSLIMVLQEVYSEETCYLMYEDKVCDITGYAVIIEQTTGAKLSFPNRVNLWQMLLFFKSEKKYGTISGQNVVEQFPVHYGEERREQILSCWISQVDSVVKPKDVFHGGKQEIKQAAPIQRIYYAYELFQGLLQREEHNKVKAFIKNLVELNLAEREQLAGQKNEFGTLAEISLYEFPACIVAAYGWAAKEEFWNVWFSLEISGCGYQDSRSECENIKEQPENDSVNAKPSKERNVRSGMLLYWMLMRKCEDEFLEFRGDKELALSKGMEMSLKEWKQMYEETRDEEARSIDIESYLAEILLELQEVWNCRYADEKLVEEFMEHTDDLRYQKALLILRKIMDRRKEDRIRISGYVSLLTNRERRFHLLGF
ncbi:MAG: hypothetical protein HFI75_09815 [Lachnospiraceae bacterium]|nr:hypothetical protein [Lachnospiraceae bacterium]